MQKDNPWLVTKLVEVAADNNCRCCLQGESVIEKVSTCRQVQYYSEIIVLECSLTDRINKVNSNVQVQWGCG